ncbi:MAG: Gfo/Idh/MocA family oxidoreductase [Opitutales bacterium]
MIGAGGRASRLNRIFAAHSDVEIAAIADVNLRHLRLVAELVGKMQGKKPQSMQDFRPIVDDPSVDVLCVGTPDHWHAIPTTLGCLAGKDVYVEKPDGHNIIEGQRMVEAMRKHKRITMPEKPRISTRRWLRGYGDGFCSPQWVTDRNHRKELPRPPPHASP